MPATSKKAPKTLYMDTKILFAHIKEIRAEGRELSFRSVALAFMPKGVKWFESGEDWGLALWMENMCLAAQRDGKHKKGTYTFNDKKCKC